MSGRMQSAEPQDGYGSFLPPGETGLSEPRSPYLAGRHWGERHLQCVWYNEKLRPGGLSTSGGEPVSVVSPGRWNLEAGPDFLDAALLVGTERRRVEGDVEIHIRPSAWTRHGHAGDPRYANVIAHVTYHPGPRPADLPRHVVSISLRDRLLATARFSFDDIDVSAYPHALLPATPRPCQAVWGDDPAKGVAVLRAAGRWRFERKRRRMEDLVARTGDPAQALYEGIMTALGYKRNAGPFRILAQSFPLAEWEQGAPLKNYACLMGLGGLLPRDDGLAAGDAGLAARLWQLWWRNPRPGPGAPVEWRMDATRPSNHPRRRLAAAAALFSAAGRWTPLLAKAGLASPSLAKDLGDMLREYSAWDEVSAFLGSPPGRDGTPRALLGDAGAAVLVNNAVMPFLAATRRDAGAEIADSLRPETISATMRTMANRLFGRDHNPAALYGGSGLLQQGLLQIYADFCLNSRDGCRDCALAKNTGDAGGRVDAGGDATRPRGETPPSGAGAARRRPGHADGGARGAR